MTRFLPAPLREWLRPLIARWAADDPAAPSDEQVAHLNTMLAASANPELAQTDGDLALTSRRAWTSPQALLALPAEAAADLLAHGDRSLVRHCEGPTCTLWFYDRTKAHQRRWCSMAICGNRASPSPPRPPGQTHPLKRDPEIGDLGSGADRAGS
jgi:predicted RNA-binding Zn ribbon-like protein